MAPLRCGGPRAYGSGRAGRRTSLVVFPEPLSFRGRWIDLMINRENELPSYPLVETALKAISDWVNSYRNAIGFKNEFGICGPDEVRRMAKDIGVTPNELQELVCKGPDNANLLKRMLVALNVDPKTIADMDPLVMREMNWLCIKCGNKRRCERELAKGTATEHFHEFCPNAVSIDELLGQSNRRVSH